MSGERPEHEDREDGALHGDADAGEAAGAAPHEPSDAPDPDDTGDSDPGTADPEAAHPADPAPAHSQGDTPANPPRTEVDFEAAFAEIVAGWEDPPAGPDGSAAAGTTGSPSPRPTGDPLPPRDRPEPPPRLDPRRLDEQAFRGWDSFGGGDDGRVDRPTSSRPSTPTTRPTPSRTDAGSAPPDDVGSGWRSYEVDDDEHFVPPPPPPLPAGDLGFWGIVVGLLLGPLLLVLHHGLGLGSGAWWSLLGGGLTLLGVTLLIARLPRDRDPRDPGNGAQV